MKIEPGKKMLYATKWPEGKLKECTIIKYIRNVADINIWEIQYKGSNIHENIIDVYLFDYPDTFIGEK